MSQKVLTNEKEYFEQTFVMFSKAWKYLAPYFSIEEPGIRVANIPVQYVYGCLVTSFMRVEFGYVPYQKGIIQGHNGHNCPTLELIGLCSKTVFQ